MCLDWVQTTLQEFRTAGSDHDDLDEAVVGKLHSDVARTFSPVSSPEAPCSPVPAEAATREVDPTPFRLDVAGPLRETELAISLSDPSLPHDLRDLSFACTSSTSAVARTAIDGPDPTLYRRDSLSSVLDAESLNLPIDACSAKIMDQKGLQGPRREVPCRPCLQTQLADKELAHVCYDQDRMYSGALFNCPLPLPLSS